MSDTRVFIDFASNALKLKEDFTGVTAAHKKSTDAMKGHYDQYRVGALASIKSVEEYRQDWAGKSTKKLIEYEHKISVERTNLINKLKVDVASADTIQTRIHKNRMEQIDAEARALKQVSAERKEVQSGGAGALISQLGIGRNLTGVFGQPTLGMGVAAGVAVVATAGIELFRKWTEAARSYEEGEDRIATSLARTNLNIEDRHRELQYVSKDVDQLSKEFVKPRTEIADIAASVAAFGRVGGASLKKLTELVIGISEATGMEASRVARLVGRAADPEVMADLKRYGIVLDKHMTQQERIDALTKQYGGTVEELKERMKDGVHTWDQLIITVENAAQKFALKEFRQLTPLFVELEPKIESFMSHLSEIKLQPAIDRLKKLYGVFKDILNVLDTITLHLFHSEQGTNKTGAFFGKGAPTADQLNPLFKQVGEFVEQHGFKAQSAALFNKLASFDQQSRDELEAKIKPPPVPGGDGSPMAAFDLAEARLRIHLTKRLIAIQDESKTEIELRKKTDAVELAFDESLLGIAHLIADGAKREEVTSQIELRIATKRGEITRVNLEKDQKTREEFYKKENAAFAGHLQGIVKSIEEEKKLEEKRILQKREIRQKIEDWEAAQIKNKEKRELAQEDIRFHRETENINREFTLAKDRNALLELLAQEHADKIAEIELQSGEDLKSIFKAGAGSVFSDFNKQISDNLGLAKKDGDVLTNMLRSVGNELLKLAEKRGIEALDKLIFGEGKAGAPDTSQAGNALSPRTSNSSMDEVFRQLGIVKYDDALNPRGPNFGGYKVVAVNPKDIIFNPENSGYGSDEATNILTYLQRLQKYDTNQFNKPAFEGGQNPKQGQEATAIGVFETYIDNKREWIQKLINEGKGQDEIIKSIIETGAQGREVYGQLAKEQMKLLGEITLTGGMSVASNPMKLVTGGLIKTIEHAGEDAAIHSAGSGMVKAGELAVGDAPGSTKNNTKETIQNSLALAHLTQAVTTNNKILGSGASKATGAAGAGLGIIAKLTKEAEGGPLGLIGGLLGSLAGFDNEGDFPVGGASGRDRNIVAFRASQNERVSVYRPQPSGSMRSAPMVSNDGVISEIRTLTNVLRAKQTGFSNREAYSASIRGEQSMSLITLD